MKAESVPIGNTGISLAFVGLSFTKQNNRSQLVYEYKYDIKIIVNVEGA